MSDNYQDYQNFLLSKVTRQKPAGFEPGPLPVGLFAWQADIVRWACRLGRAAIFAGCGLGKTLMQLAWADQVRQREFGNVLILTPLAVGPQTVEEAKRFGIENVRLVSRGSEVTRNTIAVTNYQKLLAGHFDPTAFQGVVLDESSILKSYMGKTKRLLIEAFEGTPWRLCCTATPSPNDTTELGNHAEFLGAMTSSEMLSRWFINDQAHTGEYRLKHHAAADFWQWVASWAVSVDRPSDLGYPDDGFELPPLDIQEHVVGVDLSRRDLVDGEQRLLLPDDCLTATTLHREMRQTARDRAAKVAELVATKPNRPWIVWCNTNYEADALTAAIPECVEVRGNDPDTEKERKLAAFSSGSVRVLVSKPSICGFGMNWQHCSDVAFVGLSYSHEQFYQAIRRCWRFGQRSPVFCHVVIAETEGEVLTIIKRKKTEHHTMRESMRQACGADQVRQTGPRRELTPVVRDVASGNGWTLHLGDCVDICRELPSDSIDLTVFSPPFCSLYIYSDSLADMGNSGDDEEFMRHFGYLAPELLRVTVPGRLCAIHCKDLPRYAGRDGTVGLKDFPGQIVSLFESVGWSYHSRVTIWKCPVVERERTNNNGLLHKTLKRDSSQVRQGTADYLVVLRKPPSDGLLSAKPIERTGGLDRYVGDQDPRSGDGKAHPSPHSRKSSDDPALAIWQRYAEPVWWDIDQMDVLNYTLGKSEKDEKHICPLQLGLIRRVVDLWSRPGETVLSPFAGIGSEGTVAVQEGRRFVGVELKPSYWRIAQRNLKNAETKQGELFAAEAA